MTMKMNPFVVASSTCIMIGTRASMIGIILIGVSGFLPALSIVATMGIINKKKKFKVRTVEE